MWGGRVSRANENPHSHVKVEGRRERSEDFARESEMHFPAEVLLHSGSLREFTDSSEYTPS